MHRACAAEAFVRSNAREKRSTAAGAAGFEGPGVAFQLLGDVDIIYPKKPQKTSSDRTNQSTPGLPAWTKPDSLWTAVLPKMLQGR